MATVFHPPHPNNMTDTEPSGYDDGNAGKPSRELDGDLDDMDTGAGDSVAVGGWTGDQDDLPDFNTLGDKTSPS